MNYKYFQLERVLSDFEGDLNLLAEAYDIFSGLVPDHIEKISHAISQHEAKTVKETAHSLKGMISYFNVTEVFFCAEKLEALAKSTGDFPERELNKKLSELRDVLDQMDNELNLFLTKRAS
jgi:HPt (histidine-containing phosphotransfer) domain-containing protein